ncbi:GTP 3',8-cyclase MoaA [Oscillibacter sp.]|uniref:GTP 3',8-cyclase MoaA n=1 Tax=Oscillibacter sp. TaxID=1945593 RepID=UPI00263A2BEA|nr:GTP 3',8-cyclase MoaA [Oscillibacter sp.]MDD3346582.1 GTP 3',8-cyclase MoaA [Oscillibacter sp.]
MRDALGREIDYLRVSVTDRCNLRCRYCMPHGATLVSHADILRYEELLRLCRIAASLGVTKFKVTGGEPLARRDCVEFMGQLKRLPGVEQVTLTTNGLLLGEQVDALRDAGVDGVNVSLDTLEDACYAQITGAKSGDSRRVFAAAQACAEAGIPVKLNAVLLPETLSGVVSLVEAANTLPADVRFIERMPIGPAGATAQVTVIEALCRLRAHWGDLAPTRERRGNGPAHYYRSAALRARIGVIDAVSHGFCSACNRIRLTSTGELKPCLCYEDGTDLRQILRSGATDGALREAMAACIAQKPPHHCFGEEAAATERRGMNEIGG